ncbi:hypothetical protein ACFL5L_00105 [candidate division KSB1 bacterium]
MSESQGLCPLCNNPLTTKDITENRIFLFECKICGDFGISEKALTDKTRLFPDEKKYIYSGITRLYYEKNNPITLTSDNIKDLENHPSIPQYPFDSLDRFIEYLYTKALDVAEPVPINPAKDYPLAFAKNPKEFQRFIIILSEKLQWVEFKRLSGGIDTYLLTEKGWERIKELRTKRIETNQIFVAMKLNDAELEQAWEHGYKLVENDTNYIPFRVDLKEDNERIDDEIIAGIKNSCCLVADATYNNSNVFYEAGFAKGLGLPVIWTCKKDYFEDNPANFDTRQYRHILWSDPEDLRLKLIARIRATLPLKRKN